jgi:hypothetical protein
MEYFAKKKKERKKCIDTCYSMGESGKNYDN